MSDLIYEVKDRVAWLVINREERRNALSAEAITAFAKALDAAEADEGVRVIAVTGAGDKTFCSGADLMASFTGGDPVEGMRAYAEMLKRMAVHPKPMVARVAGHCLAGGLGLLLSCDVAYAREGVQFWTPELGVGLFPMMIGTLIFRNVGRKKALEMIYSGRRYSAPEAAEMGLITRALPAESFEGEVNEVLQSIADKAPVAMRLGRQALAKVEDMALDPALDYLCGQLGEVIKTEDAAEGLMAFMQKRKPEWKGR